MSFRAFIGEDLSIEDEEKFCEWGFGPNYMVFESPLVFMTSWNERHGDKLYLNEYGTIGEDVKEMIDIWKKRKKS